MGHWQEPDIRFGGNFGELMPGKIGGIEIGHPRHPHAAIGREITVPSYEEIKAARAVLTDDRIVDIQRGVAPVENVIKRMLEAAEKVRSSERPCPAIS